MDIFLRFTDLPKELRLRVLKLAVPMEELGRAVRCRLVCKEFDHEIMKLVFQQGLLEEAHEDNIISHISPYVHDEKLVAKYILWRMEREEDQRDGLDKIFHAVLDTLEKDEILPVGYIRNDALRCIANWRALNEAPLIFDRRNYVEYDAIGDNQGDTFYQEVFNGCFLAVGIMLGSTALSEEIVARAPSDLYSGPTLWQTDRFPVRSMFINAARGTDSRLLQELLDINRQSHTTQYPRSVVERNIALEAALYARNEESVRLILSVDHRIAPNMGQAWIYDQKGGARIRQRAAKEGLWDSFVLLHNAAGVDFNHPRTLCMLATSGCTAMMQRFVEKYPQHIGSCKRNSTSHRYYNPVLTAAHKGHFDIVRLLLEKGADVGFDETCSEDLPYGGFLYPRVIRELLRAETPDDDSVLAWWILQQAAATNDTELLRVWLNPVTGDILRRTPGKARVVMESAILRGSVSAARMLLPFRPRVHGPPSEHWDESPLHLAIETGATGIASLLRQDGARLPETERAQAVLRDTL